MNQDIKPHLLP